MQWILILFVVILLIGCQQTGAQTGKVVLQESYDLPKSTDWINDIIVVTTKTGLDPAELTITPGTRVVWKNPIDRVALIQDYGQYFRIRILPFGQGDFVFNEEGTYMYREVHLNWKGKVEVRAS